MGELDENTGVVAQPANRKHINKIWFTAGILAVATLIEFTIVYLIARGPVLITAFVLLTLLKAFYIVGEFMHLKGEVKTLIWSILIPTVFIAWLILALIAEGSSVFELRF